MSRFSGKSDLFDSVNMIHQAEDFSKVHIYIDNNPVELRVNNQKDLIPYYACVPWAEGWDGNEGIIRITGELWFNQEEREILETSKQYWIGLYNKYKRKNLDPAEELKRLINEQDWWTRSDYQLVEATINNKGKDFDTSHIHLDSKDYYRKILYNEMVENGYDKDRAYIWVYGLTRWIESRKGDSNE